MTKYIYVCTGARVGHKLEKVANMIIILLLLTIINIHIRLLTSIIIITIVQTTSKFATPSWLIKKLYIVQLDSYNYSDTYHEISSLLVVVKSHLFPQYVRLN